MIFKNRKITLVFVIMLLVSLLAGCGQNEKALARKINKDFERYGGYSTYYKDEITEDNFGSFMYFQTRIVSFQHNTGAYPPAFDTYVCTDLDQLKEEMCLKGYIDQPEISVYAEHGETGKPGKNNIYISDGSLSGYKMVYILYKNTLFKSSVAVDDIDDFDAYLKDLEHIDFSWSDKYTDTFTEKKHRPAYDK